MMPLLSFEKIETTLSESWLWWAYFNDTDYPYACEMCTEIAKSLKYPRKMSHAKFPIYMR